MRDKRKQNPSNAISKQNPSNAISKQNPSNAISKQNPSNAERYDYHGPIEHSLEIAIEGIQKLLKDEYSISGRLIAILLLQEDDEIFEIVEKKQPKIIKEINEIIQDVKSHYSHPVEYEIALRRSEEIANIIKKVVKIKSEAGGFREKLSRLMMNPLTGFPIFLFIMYWGLYRFVGVWGAGTVVDFLEGTVFEEYINPFIINFFVKIIPWQILQDLFVGEYGIITFGFTYAVALILPIVALFFLVFAVIEDTGYLPRLAMLIDRVFKKIGLSGRAVIPLVLGFGCDTMATMITRTLPTKRERIIATMLLALAIPCSAQLGVILALLAGKGYAVFVWAMVVVGVFLFIGYLSAKVLPGEKPSFYMELPPIRFPKIFNVFLKTYVRVRWYFKEILPLFLLASLFIWLGQITGLFDLAIGILRYPVELIGLPSEGAKMFLFGFFRRDYGAAGLYELNKQGLLTVNQLVVACIALTLFLPCIAQFLINVKERGWKTGLGISVFVFFFSFGVAYLVNNLLNILRITL